MRLFIIEVELYFDCNVFIPPWTPVMISSHPNPGAEWDQVLPNRPDADLYRHRCDRRAEDTKDVGATRSRLRIAAVFSLSSSGSEKVNREDRREAVRVTFTGCWTHVFKPRPWPTYGICLWTKSRPLQARRNEIEMETQRRRTGKIQIFSLVDEESLVKVHRTKRIVISWFEWQGQCIRSESQLVDHWKGQSRIYI